MKKIISFILSLLIIVMSIFSTTAFAQEQTRHDKWSQGKSFDEIEAIIYNDDGYNQTEMHVYLKDNKILMTSSLPLFSDEEKEITLLFDGKNYYMFITSLPFFHFKLGAMELSIPDLLDEIAPRLESTYIRSYEVTEKSTTYYVEEYSETFDYDDYTQEGIRKYYFINDELIKNELIYTDENGDSVCTCMELISFEVDDSVFELPWYSINVLPFFELLLSLFEIGIIY